MAKYIRSHSNYRLNTKHQDTSLGTILERDISTVGGIDTFAKGQSTIYSSGNFVMTVNNSPSASRHIIKSGWLANSESGDTWNGLVLQNYTSDVNGSVERSMTMKNDFMDLRSFACYGSMYHLAQSSIAGIVDSFPYELYTGKGEFQTQSSEQELMRGSTSSSSSSDISHDTQNIVYGLTPVSYTSGIGDGDLYEVYNPAGIDIHTSNLDEEVTNPMKYFANDGYTQYSVFFDNWTDNPSDGSDFEWQVDYNNRFVISELTYGSIILPELSTDTVGNSNLYVICFKNVLRASTVNINNVTYTLQESVAGSEPQSVTFNSGDVIYGRIYGRLFMYNYMYCPEAGDYVATVTLTSGESSTKTFTKKIYAIYGDDLAIKYVVNESSLDMHIRPRESLGYYDEFIDSLDQFQKCLMGVYSGKRNTASFEIYTEGDYGTEKTVEVFRMPTGEGGYNIATDGFAMSEYIRRLAKVGLRYDEEYTDNLYRVMTHESLKNFDWTRNFNGNASDYDNEYVETGEKFKSVIRIMGYVFDREKMYIDCISNNNTITYDNRSNLADYFLTDSLETDGWDVCTIYPLELHEFDSSGNTVDSPSWTEEAQAGNIYTRKFSENTTELITPYERYEGAYYWTCDENSNPVLMEIENDNGGDYYNDHGVVKNVIRDYHDSVEFTIPDVNNEFMKRLRINSRRIFSRKGTVEGIESLLGLFGFRSKRWYDTLIEENPEFTEKYSKNLSRKYPYDFDVQEYTTFAPPIREGWDVTHSMYLIDYYNSCKTIPYNTQSYINGKYISYQGLPVAYRDIDTLFLTATKDASGNTVYGESSNSGSTNVCIGSDGLPVHVRKLYPDFESNGIYDGDMFYQMNGGWLNLWPYSYDTDENIMTNYFFKSSQETFRSVKQVGTLSELLRQPSSELKDGVIYYVNDLSANYAIIDGYLYELYSEVDENDSTQTQYYFKVSVGNQCISIGDSLFNGYLVVSNPYTDDLTQKIYIPGLEDGYIVKVYYMPDNEEPFTIYGYADVKYYRKINDNGEIILEETTADDPMGTPSYSSALYAESMYVFMNGSYHDDYENYTHYFMLSDSYQSFMIASDGWYQLAVTDSQYQKLNSIVDNYNGNNPHSGGDGYDNGYEYLSRYNQLFKYAYGNRLFNDECFVDVEGTYDKISKVGFSGLTSSQNGEYFPNIHPDKKVHTFCNVIESGDTSTEIEYSPDSASTIYSISDYAFVSGMTEADGVTNQIVNIKTVDISFYIPSDNFFSKEAQEYMKYLHTKVVPYLEQVLPSTIIPRFKCYIKPYNWIFDGEDERWEDSNYWIGTRQWPST